MLVKCLYYERYTTTIRYNKSSIFSFLLHLFSIHRFVHIELQPTQWDVHHLSAKYICCMRPLIVDLTIASISYSHYLKKLHNIPLAQVSCILVCTLSMRTSPKPSLPQNEAFTQKPKVKRWCIYSYMWKWPWVSTHFYLYMTVSHL